MVTRPVADGPSLLTLRLDLEPLLRHLTVAAYADGHHAGIGEWLRTHPRGGDADYRALCRARRAGTVAAYIADRIAVHLLGLTLDEIYGPDWDDREVPA
jgi:hypothetical protein